MRFIFLMLALISFLSPKAQTHLPVSSIYFTPWQTFPGYHASGDSSQVYQKWYFSKYAGISAGYVFFNGGGGPVISAPVGLQLNHPLNNNLIAFAGISVAPTFFSFNSAVTNPALYKSYPGSYMSNAYNFGFNSRIEMGLMYVNDAKTFSISGSIGVERSSYPYFPANRTNSKNNIR